MNRHPLVQAAFDNGSGSCQGKNILVLLSFWHEGYPQRTPLREQRGSFISAFSPKHLTTSSHPNDDRPMIAPAARMISSCLIPADAQKTTFSDD
jgi:hypothetical protein